jgi:hypothetical protein
MDEAYFFSPTFPTPIHIKITLINRLTEKIFSVKIKSIQIESCENLLLHESNSF